MKISVIQPDIAWEDKSRNFQRLAHIVEPLFNNTDLVILPEMFNTGFSMRAAELSEPTGGETFLWMKKIAREGNFGICGSCISQEGMQFFNRWIFVSPEGDSFHYDKRHLFSMGGEDRLFTGGKTRLVFSFRGARIAPFICYDLRFPVWSRNHNEYDIAIYSANWPEVRQNVWQVLLNARAIENQCFVAASNRIGTDGEGIKYCGESMIISPRGELLNLGERDRECSITSEISLTDQISFRKKFPVGNDADEFIIKA
jgi:omega-amidase